MWYSVPRRKIKPEMPWDFSGSPTAKCVTVVTCKYDDIVVRWDNMYTKCYLREEMLTKHSQSARGRMAFTWKRIAHGLDWTNLKLTVNSNRFALTRIREQKWFVIEKIFEEFRALMNQWKTMESKCFEMSIRCEKISCYNICLQR